MSVAFEVAWDKLAQFETADEIAEFFRAEGITGWRHLSSHCAIAEWMHSTTGFRTSVSPINMWSHADGTWISEEHGQPNTAAMTDFIRRFDAGDFPDITNVEDCNA